MIEANFDNHTLIHYDGLSGYKHTVYSCLVACYLEKFFTCINCPRKSEKFLRWKVINCSTYPKQNNGDDCGVFVIHGMACMSFNKSQWQWKCNDINYLRKYYSGALYTLKNEQEFNFQRMFGRAINSSNQLITEAPLLMKLKVCTPEKRNPKAAIYHSLDINYGDLALRLQTYPWHNLIAWAMLTQIATDGGVHRDYQSHIDWIVANIDDWPLCSLERIPNLKKEYLLALLNWDFCLATGHARTDLGMALVCFTLRCCRREFPCMLLLMHNYTKYLQQWIKMSVEQRDNFIEHSMYRALAEMNEEGQYVVSTERTLCIRSWQALYGVHSERLNSVFKRIYSLPAKTDKWAKAVKKVTTAQEEELNRHLESVLLPNPFASRGLNERTHVCPPEIGSFHQLYLHYVWEHIRNCSM